MTCHNSHLAAKVAGLNRAHTVARELAPRLLAALSPYVGKKVVNKTGEHLAHAVEAVLRERAQVPDTTPSTQILIRGDKHSVFLWVRTVESWQKPDRPDYTGNIYQEATVTLGSVRNWMLESLWPFNPEHMPTNYSEAAIRIGRARVEQAKTELASAERAVYPFGLHDN